MRIHTQGYGLLAGFTADRPSAGVPELIAVGDQWAPSQRRMGWHVHREWEIYLQLDGVVGRESEDFSCEMRAGDLFIAPPGRRHRVLNRGSARQHNCFMRLRLAPALARHPECAPSWRLRACVHQPRSSIVEQAMRALVHEVAFTHPLRDQGLRWAIDGVVLMVTRCLLRQEATAVLPLPEVVLRAQQLLDLQRQRPWRLRDLASEVHCSASHLLALFNRHLGMPPHRYLMRRRIEQAQHLVADTDASITDIAHELGFSSSQHFAKVFRAQLGETASAMRRRGRLPALR